MVEFIFTNDLRISRLREKIKEVAILVKNNRISELGKSEQNNANAIKFYFNLQPGTNTLEAAAHGNVDAVILNFLRKFQFPNPREARAYVSNRQDGVRLKPYNAIISLLYTGYLQDSNFYLTLDEIYKFIFSNPRVYGVRNVDYISVLSSLLDYRTNKQLPTDITSPVWNNYSRQLREMIKISTWIQFLKYDQDKLSLKIENSSVENKAAFLDIVFDQSFLDAADDFTRFKSSYIRYMDIESYSLEDQSQDESNLVQVDTWNKIYYGAPGTGKSYSVSEEIKSIYPNYIEEESADYVVRTSLHPEYTYSDFVGQVMPVKNGEDITYDFKPGVFTNALKKAIELPGQAVYLVLEELSRANVAAVFGDLFQLLDRNDNGVSQYKISNPIIAKEIHGNNCENDDIRLPANLLIRGTVNTNDQNVFVMDTAFKRRFEWEYVSTEPVIGANGEFLNNPEIEYQRGSKVSWCEFYQAVNDYITSEMELGEDKQIGQFFIKFADQGYSERNQTLIKNKLLQYLWEDVDKASFNARLFSSAIKNFSTLYKMFGSGERVFSTLFLNNLGTPNSNTTPTEADTSETEGESNAEAEE